MRSSDSTENEKKTYDDISYEKRRQLIELIQTQGWTIKAAAHRLSIKLCTAKYILYHYRKEGKIYCKKKETYCATHEPVGERESPSVVYVPLPMYIVCYCPVEQMPINLEYLQLV